MSMIIEKWKKLVDYLEENKNLGIEFLRMSFGLCLFFEGIYFIGNKDLLEHLLNKTNLDIHLSFFEFYIGLTHICGGLFLSAGLFTRLASLIQIPNLVGAIAFVHGKTGLFNKNQTLEFNLLVLLLLVSFTIFGGGYLSMDHVLKLDYVMEDEEEEEIEARKA